MRPGTDGKSGTVQVGSEMRPAERDALDKGSGYSIPLCGEGVKRAYKPKPYNHEGHGAECKMRWQVLATHGCSSSPEIGQKKTLQELKHEVHTRTEIDGDF